jgi:CBS-domain-containing membrane protein
MDRVPARMPFTRGLLACLGIFIAIGCLGYCTFDLAILLALGSFGSTSILLFCFPENDFSQPRSIIGGHVMSTAVGLAAVYLCGKQWWAMGAAVSVAAALMMVTNTIHPPAGSNPLIVFLSLPSWDFLIFPTFTGAVLLVLVGLAYHRACQRPYPRYWLGRRACAAAGDPPATGVLMTATGAAPR